MRTKVLEYGADAVVRSVQFQWLLLQMTWMYNEQYAWAVFGQLCSIFVSAVHLAGTWSEPAGQLLGLFNMPGYAFGLHLEYA